MALQAEKALLFDEAENLVGSKTAKTTELTDSLFHRK